MRFAGTAILIGSATLTTGCVSPFGPPTLKHGVVSPWREGPNVEALVVHTNCELARAIYDSMVPKKDDLSTRESRQKFYERKARWARLEDENFVATVDFTLTATNSEGFDPSVSSIVPTTALGTEISPILVPPVPQVLATGPSPTGTSNTYNRTLAVGIQANGTQDRNFDLTYLVDLHRLYTAVTNDSSAPKADGNTYVGLKDICTLPKDPRSYTGLEGNLDLFQTVDFGLQGLQKGKDFAYGAEGPVRREDLITKKPPPAAAADQRAQGPEARVAEVLSQDQVEAAMEAFNLSPAAATNPKTSAGPQATNTTFSSKIDFTIIQGLNGGPSWQLLKWKIGGGGGTAGGGGGGAGGGGGGAGAGGGGAGGGAGGGGGQMLNWSRTVLDTLTITFAPTCSSRQTELSVGNYPTPSNTLTTTDTEHSYVIALPSGLQPLNKFGLIIEPQGNANPSAFVQVARGGVSVYGSVQWRGFVDASNAFELLGTVSDPVTTNPVGAVVLRGTVQNGSLQLSAGHITRHLYSHLSGGSKTIDYWGSIQSCDLTTSAQIQAAVNNASNTNTLLKLTNADRQRLQQ